MEDQPRKSSSKSFGLIGAVELAPRPLNDGTGAVAAGARGFEVFEKCWAKGVFVRPVGDNVAFCPPLICEKQHLDRIFSTVAEVLGTVA